MARIPTLITHAGDALGDSTLACLYLNDLASPQTVIPAGADAWRMWSLYAIADGLIEAQIAMRAEYLRDEHERSSRFLGKQQDRIRRCFDALEQRVDELDRPLDLAQITVGVACGYQDWREWLDPYQAEHPALASWSERFAQRASMIATQPTETPQR
ncbi:MAG: glutathione S-transferase [Gammaproteobacteria bacterium]|nr:glutathione S-transferase [Gammaproteobacteria bacterium]